MAGVYIHVPFCRQRCSYCDFYFVTSHKRVEAFVDAVCAEITLRARTIAAPDPIKTIYFGGGTPSRLHPDQLVRILTAVSDAYDTGIVDEITIEVNPEDPDDNYLDRVRQMGFTRLSVGLQSLHEEDLTFMLRSHTRDQATAFLEMALTKGFESISVDLIFGLPGTTTLSWRHNLEYAAGSGAHHVSLYGLTVEPRTLLGKWVRAGKVIVTPEESMERQYRMAAEIMGQNGFDHYEISNFAKPGHRSRHNRSYWNHSNYLGFGPGAHSFWKSDRAVRWENVRSLTKYLGDINDGSLPISSEEELGVDSLMQEYVLLGLRTDAGVDLNRLRGAYGHELSPDGLAVIMDLVDADKAVLSNDRVTLTLNGRLVADSITSVLLNSNAIVEIENERGRLQDGIGPDQTS